MLRNATFGAAPLLLAAAMLAGAGCGSIGLSGYERYIDALAARRAEHVAAAIASPAGAAAPARPAAGPLALDVRGAILLALENNRALAVQRLAPAIRETYEDQERAVFDPTVTAAAGGERTKEKQQLRTGGLGSLRTHTLSAGASIAKYSPSGTTVGADLATEAIDSSVYTDDLVATRLGLTVTQALLRGAGVQANLVRLRQAELDTLASRYELRGFAESLVAAVESTYWDYALAERQIEIYTDSLRLAEKQLAENRERITIGKLAETEQAAAEAELALRRENLINARSALATSRLALLRLLNAPQGDWWQRELVLRDRPAVPQVRLDDVANHAEVALRMRPDLNEARLQLRRDELEVVLTKNGLLPKLDLFVSLGKTAYAESLGGSLHDPDGRGYDVYAGLTCEYPLGNRDARTRHRRAVLSRRQAAEALGNLAQLVQLDVRLAYIEVSRANEQITATAATRKLQEVKHRVETEKFRVGKSTSLLVAQAQRDLVASQIAEVEALVNYLKALVELHRLEGSLLERRGISVPGGSPPDEAPATRPAP